MLKSGSDRGVQNDILHDYHTHLLALDRKVRSFETDPIGTWSRSAWKGFFSVLQERLGQGDWSYVNNESGGFMAFWWHASETGKCSQYLQLENEKLCFKIKVEDRENYSRLRRSWHRRVVSASKYGLLPVQKPIRFGHGAHMTVAVLPHDYRASDSEDLLDLETTISRVDNGDRFFYKLS